MTHGPGLASARHARGAREALRPPPAAPASRERQLYVDWLRLLALAGVFVIHVCSVFDPFDAWHITNAERSRLAGEVVVLMAPWIMPLFMLLAGVSAWYSLQRRSNGVYVRERLVRLLLPLVVGVVVLVPPQVWLERRLRGQFDGSLLAFYPHFFTEGLYPKGNLSWHHLWFLAHLFVYSLVALPLFRHWQHERGRAQLAWLARRATGPAGLLWLALPLVLERHLLWGLFRERHMLTTDWSNQALLFVAYLYGFVLAGEPWLGATIDARWRHALVPALASTAALMTLSWRGVIPGHLPPPYSPGYLAFWTLYALGAWAWIVAVLGAGRRLLRVERPMLAYSRDTGYAWYLLHQPVIVAVAFLVVQWRAGVPAKVAAILVASLGATLAGGELLRRSPITRTVLGVSSAGPSAPARAPRPVRAPRGGSRPASPRPG